MRRLHLSLYRPARLGWASALLCAAAAIVGCGDRSGRAERAVALHSLTSTLIPIGATPNGRHLLLKSTEDSTFTLSVVERTSGRTVSEVRLRNAPLAATLRPDGGAVAYLGDEKGNQRYVPMLMDVGSATVRSLGGPATSIPGALQWSPDGARLAYLHASRTARGRRLMVSAPTPSGATWDALLPDLAPRAGFAWALDGRRLAAVQRSSRGAITVVSITGSAREYPVAANAEIRDLLWTTGGRVIATARKPGREFFGVVQVELSTGHVRNVVDGPWDAVAPQALWTGGAWGFHANVDSELVPLVCHPGAADCRRLALPAGSSRILGSVPGSDTVLVSHRGRSTPPVLLPVPPGRTVRRAEGPSQNTGSWTPPVAERIDLRSAGGLPIPLYMWQAPRQRDGGRAAVVRVHGGPAVQADRAWDRTTEYLLKGGADVVQLNYRGSTGYGASHELAYGGECARVQDVLAAVSFVERELGVPRGRIVLYGHSYGALLVAMAAKELPKPVGAIVLVSMVGDAERAPPRCSDARNRSWSPSRVRGYHGVNDQGLSPADARRAVANLYGWGPLQRARARWRVFDDEGHTFHRNQSWAYVYSDILAVLDDGS